MTIFEPQERPRDLVPATWMIPRALKSEFEQTAKRIHISASELARQALRFALDHMDEKSDD